MLSICQPLTVWPSPSASCLPPVTAKIAKRRSGAVMIPASRRFSRPSSVADLLSASAGDRRVGLKSGRASTVATCPSSSTPLSRGAATGLQIGAATRVADGSRRVPASNSANSNPAKTAHPTSGREARRRAIMRTSRAILSVLAKRAVRHAAQWETISKIMTRQLCRVNPCPQSRVDHDEDERGENSPCWTTPPASFGSARAPRT
jgi:hypothetical protein